MRKCPYCGDKLDKAGFMRTDEGKIPQFYCEECNSTFALMDGELEETLNDDDDDFFHVFGTCGNAMSDLCGMEDSYPSCKRSCPF